MFSPLVSINEDYPLASKSAPRLVRSDKPSFTAAFLLSLAANSLPTPAASFSVTKGAELSNDDDDELHLSDFLDIPLLVSDNEEESDGESACSKNVGPQKTINTAPPAIAAAQEVKRFMREEHHTPAKAEPAPEEPAPVERTDKDAAQPAVAGSASSAAQALTAAEFSTEKNKVMKIVVKYVAMKISNSFPPESPRTMDPKELPLDQFLMVLVSRLQLSLPLFMKGIIYLFRYMDIIYLLRYLNQSNNFANYTDMGFGLKKLIIGCFRLTLARERITKDWSSITGLGNAQINTIVKTVVGRLNGKLTIKNVELVRLRTEIFRFVKMVTKIV